MTPSLTASTWWLARPMRCMPLATDGGASICTTRSIAPMSMPSSSDEVATSAGIRPGLQRVLDLDALRARQRAVVRPHDRLARQLVERAGQALGQAAAVDEEQRGAVRRGPARAAAGGCWTRSTARRALRRGAARDLQRLRQLRQVLDRHLDAQGEPLRLPRVDDGDRPVVHLPSAPARLVVRPRSGQVGAGTAALVVAGPGAADKRVAETTVPRSSAGLRSAPPRNRATSSSGPLRGGQPDALERPAAQAPAAARATAPGARRAWSAPARGSRPRSPSRPSAGPRARCDVSSR